MKTIYLDTINGVDTRDGLTPAKAVKTIARACSLAEFGDTVEIESGSRIGASVAKASDGIFYYDETNSTDPNLGSSKLLELKSGVTYKKCTFSQVYEKPIISGMVEIPVEGLEDIFVGETALKHFKLQHRCAPITNDKSISVAYLQDKAKSWLAVVVNDLKLTKTYSKEECANLVNSYYSEDIVSPTGRSDGASFICDTYGIGGFYFNFDGEIESVKAPFFQTLMEVTRVVLDNIVIESGAVKNNISARMSRLKGVELKFAMMHGGLYPSNEVSNCESDAAFCGFHSYVDTTIHGVRFSRCISDRSRYREMGIYGFYTHGNTTAPNARTQKLSYYCCLVDNYETAFIVGDHKYAELNNSVAINCKALAQGFQIVKNCLMMSKPKTSSEILRGTMTVENCGLLGTRHAVKGLIKNCTFVTQGEDTEWSDTSQCTYENCIFTERFLGEKNMNRVFKNCYFRLNTRGSLWSLKVDNADVYSIDELMDLYPDNFIDCKSNVKLVDQKLWTLPTVQAGKASKGYVAEGSEYKYWVYDGRYLTLSSRLPKYVRHNRGSATYDCDLAVYTNVNDAEVGYYPNYAVGLNYYTTVNRKPKYGADFGSGVSYTLDKEDNVFSIKIDLDSSNVFSRKETTEIHVRYYEVDDSEIFDGLPQVNKYRLLRDSAPYKMGVGCDFTNVVLPDKESLEADIL